MTTWAVDDYGALADGTGDTVAEWLVGGKYDRGYADLSAIQVDHARATSLDVTIDQVAVLEAFDAATAAADTDMTLSFGAGVYVMFRMAITADQIFLAEGTSIAIVGAGRTSTTIKRADGALDPLVGSTQPMMQIRSNVPVGTVTVRDLTLDGNATNNPLSGGDDYEFQHSAGLRIAASNGSSWGAITVTDVGSTDPAADGIAFVINTATEFLCPLVSVTRFVGANRNRTRADLQFYPGIADVQVADCAFTALEWEFQGSVTNHCTATITDCTADLMDIAGVTADSLRVALVRCTNLRTLMWHVGIDATDCDLGIISDNGGIRDTDACTFTRCTLYSRVTAGVIQPISVTREDARDTDLLFVECSFLASDVPTLGTLFAAATVGGAVTDAHRQRFVACTFDPRADYAISVNRNGRTQTEGCAFTATGAGVFIGHGSGPYSAEWTSINDSFAQCPPGGAYLLGSYHADGDQLTTITITGQWQNAWVPSESVDSVRLVWNKSRTFVSPDSLDGVDGSVAAGETSVLGDEWPAVWAFDSAANNRWVYQGAA